jgi:hypothetical protein
MGLTSDHNDNPNSANIILIAGIALLHCVYTDDVHIHHLFVRCEPSSNQPRRSMKKFVDVRHVQDTLLLVTLNLCLIVMDNDVVCNAGMVEPKGVSG